MSQPDPQETLLEYVRWEPGLQKCHPHLGAKTISSPSGRPNINITYDGQTLLSNMGGSCRILGCKIILLYQDPRTDRCQAVLWPRGVWGLHSATSQVSPKTAQAFPLSLTLC